MWCLIPVIPGLGRYEDCQHGGHRGPSTKFRVNLSCIARSHLNINETKERNGHVARSMECLPSIKPMVPGTAQQRP